MIKLNSRWVNDLNVKKLSNKLFLKNQGDCLYNPILGEQIKNTENSKTIKEDKYLTI